MERQRHLYLWLKTHTDFFGARHRVLHWAPEGCFVRAFRGRANLDYETADLDPEYDPDHVVDITDTGLPGESYDVMLCSHVLEHVPDDRAAMREMFRLLRPGGWLVAQVPLYAGDTTVEDPDCADPAERLRRFGQADHIRIYGRDFYDRLREAGFEVDLHRFRDEIPESKRRRYALAPDLSVIQQDEKDSEFWTIPRARRPDRPSPSPAREVPRPR
jgi:SAM-dependent methyltransferase